MRKIVTPMLLTIVSWGAIAADLPSRKSPPPIFAQPTKAQGWTGFFIGINAGYADPTAKFRVTPGGSWIGDPDVPFVSPTSPGVINAGTRNLRLHGFTGGVQIGYNYQIDNIILGVIADANYLGLRSSYGTPAYNGLAGGLYWAHGSASLNAFYTLRGRLGFAMDRWFLFGTGGIGFTNQKFRQSINYMNDVVPGLPMTPTAGGANAGRASKLAVSWTLGAGVEYALSEKWSLFGEYLHLKLKPMNFSSVYGPVANVEAGTWHMQHRLNLTGLHVFRLGLNYHFGK